MSASENNFVRESRAKSAANHSGKRLVVLGDSEENKFWNKLESCGLDLNKSQIEILQINLGKLCNLTCDHCHVEAGPNRTELITPETIKLLLSAAKTLSVKTVDLTGGAPEMCPGFKDYVRQFRGLGCEVIVRSNLTILLEQGYEDFIDFFKEQGIWVIASLPCYTEDNVDAQRGDGVFRDSIEALKRLNKVGYGQAGTNLKLDLVYNPGGPSLPGPQDKLEQDYKNKLLSDFGISFNSLYCITNLPLGRFYSELKKEGRAEAYDKLLEDNFNLATIPALMCKNTLNVSWDGWLYDCDFNQMLELPIELENKAAHISNQKVLDLLKDNKIATGNHCFGCTAGAGSSCGGELL